MATLSDDERVIAQIIRALETTKLEAMLSAWPPQRFRARPSPLNTQHVDLLIRDTPLNRDKVRAFAKELGAAVTRSSPLSNVLTVVGGPAPVDILFEEIAGSLRFEALRARAIRIRIGQSEAVVASLEDIVASKQAAGRPKDIAQLPILRDTLRVLSALDSE